MSMDRNALEDRFKGVDAAINSLGSAFEEVSDITRDIIDRLEELESDRDSPYVTWVLIFGVGLVVGYLIGLSLGFHIGGVHGG